MVGQATACCISHVSTVGQVHLYLVAQESVLLGICVPICYPRAVQPEET